MIRREKKRKKRRKKDQRKTQGWNTGYWLLEMGHPVLRDDFSELHCSVRLKCC